MYCLAVETDGTVWVWGDSPQGEFTIPTVLLSSEITEYMIELSHYGEEKVNCSGNFSRTYTDMTIDTPGFNINISRTYNSANDEEGPFGDGWTFGFQGNIERYNSRQKIVHLPDGSGLVFQRSGTGYKAQNSRATLVYDDGYILTTPDQYTYNFDTDGWLTSMTDRNGNTIDITVDASGNPTAITYLTDQTINITYTGDHITSITDPAGRTVQYAYDGDKLITVTDPRGKATHYDYDNDDYLSEVRDNDNNLIELIWYDEEDVDHRVFSVTDAYGNQTVYEYDDEDRIVSTIDTDDRETTTWFDEYLYPIQEEDAEGGITTTEYNLNADDENLYGEVTSYTDRNGNTTSYERDDHGNITIISNPDFTTKEFGYDDNNNKLWEMDEDGKYTFYVYDENGINLIKKAQPLNGTDQYGVDGVDSDYAITEYTYYSDGEAATPGV